MSEQTKTLKVFLDAGVPVAVGGVFEAARIEVIYYRDALPEKVSDDVVCATAIANNAVLVAMDGDMKRKPRAYGVKAKGNRFENLSLIHICCPGPQAANRVRQCLSLIQHEWRYATTKVARRLWVEVAPNYVRTNR